MALSAFDSFCQGVEQGQFSRLQDRDDLWHILAVITVRKAVDLVQHERRQKRGGGRLRKTLTKSCTGLSAASRLPRFRPP